jgi:hypothetical protein
MSTKQDAQPALVAPAGSETDKLDQRMLAEADLMTAAAEFASTWGVDQTAHPRSYWLDLHIERWSDLARAALAYAEALRDSPNSEMSDRAGRNINRATE